ncbi:MAG: acyl-CoA dehydrogenase family protein, partial [Dongiaceae bacterium]
MTYPLPAHLRALKQKLRTFLAEDVIPWETHAEMNGGEIPADVRAEHYRKANALGLHGISVPKEYGGAGMTALEQAVVQEEIGRVTNGLGWCFHSTPPWMIGPCS